MMRIALERVSESEPMIKSLNQPLKTASSSKYVSYSSGVISFPIPLVAFVRAIRRQLRINMPFKTPHSANWAVFLSWRTTEYLRMVRASSEWTAG